MKIKVLFLDLDGTTLETNKVYISPRNMAAIRAALQKGVTVVPCTGRVLDMHPLQLEQMRELRYFITCHGADVVDRRTGESLYRDVFTPEQSAEVCRLFEGRGLYAEIAANRTIYLEKAVSDTLQRQPVPAHHVWYFFGERRQSVVETPSEYFLHGGIGIEKVNLYGIPQDIRQELYDALTALPFLRHTRPGAGPDLEFSHATLDKCKGVSALLTHLGVRPEECMILGDSSSDVDVMRMVGLGIAMGNAPDWIRAQADDVAPRSDEDGVAAMIEKYLL